MIMTKGKEIIFFSISILLIIAAGYLGVERNISDSGIVIAGRPVQDIGDIITMEISSTRPYQTIDAVTYEIKDDDEVIVHISQSFCKRGMSQSQTLQLLVMSQNKVTFMCGNTVLKPYFQRQYRIWKAVN